MTQDIERLSADRDSHQRAAIDAGLALTEAREKIARLEGVLERIDQGDIPRPVASYWRRDLKPCKHDQCAHQRSMWEDCGECVSSFVRAALSEPQP